MSLRRRDRRARPRRRGALLALLVAIAVLDSATLAGAAVLHARRLDRVSGSNAVSAPSFDAADGATGAFTTTIDYAALFSADGHQVSSEVAWDDDWFFSDPTSYNHELAHTCAVLSAVANAESAYYQQGSSVPAYAESALAQLGFDEVCTDSYRYRSEVLDEVLGVVEGNDVVAYTLATKRVRSSVTGEERLLTVVAVRGSYGSEWLSNARLGDGVGDDGDHLGFTLAAREIVSDLEERAASDDSGLERVYLFCGHSRGGAVASLLGSYADDAASGAHALTSADDVYAYAFATPRCTTAADARDARYDNVFNVLNPSDVVPMLLPAAWGYDRYGRDVWLPALDGTSTRDAELAGAMGEAYTRTMGSACPCEPGDRAAAEALVAGVVAGASGPEELLTPSGLGGLATSCLGADWGQLLTDHYPNTYVAWLEATSAGDLTIS